MACRKIKSLLSCGAQVTAVSPRINDSLDQLLGREQIIKGKYHSRYCQGKYLVIAATDSKQINRQVARDARKAKALVNVVDQPASCDFILPAVVKRGDLQLAISTGGRSPALAKKIRQDLEAEYPVDFAEVMELMGELRELIKENVVAKKQRKIIFNKMAELIQTMK